MDRDSERAAVDAAMTTAEHKSLGDVLDIIRRLEELRARGLSSVQIAEQIRLTHPNRPGGGPWSVQAVERVLEISDANRGLMAPTAKNQHAPAPQPTTQPVQTVPSPPPSFPMTDQAGERRAPLRVEPRRYHQRPPFDEPATESEDRRRWPLAVGILTLVGLLAAGAAMYRNEIVDRLTTSAESAQSASLDESPSAESAGEPSTADRSSGDAAADAEEPSDETVGAVTSEGADLAEGDSTDGADSMTIRIEPSNPQTDSGIAPASATIRNDGRLYIEGAFRSEAEAERFLASAAEVFGEAALVSEYTIDPAAPDPTVSDVVLEKPVLFESGSAVIAPEFIPFLEACGDVLKLNSHIVMSVTAFTDASGDAEFNLELSQQRADAVIEFYRNLDIGSEQLISTGVGETQFVADNSTEEGRQQNRRAMLELLNVMRDG